jgi:peptidyl-prolyl cis-trans isomerase A (cyclophilin A)
VKKIILILCILFGTHAIGAEDASMKEPQYPICIIKTSMGEISAELWPDKAPKTVANFIGLAEGKKEFTDINTKKKVTRPFYDGLTFHRVIKGFMIQGGCLKGDGTSNPGYRFEDEINAESLGLHKIKAIHGKRTHPYLGIRSQKEFEREVLHPLFRKMGIKTGKEWKARSEEVNKRLQSLTLKECYENQGYRYNTALKSNYLIKGVLGMANTGPNTNGAQFFICLVDTPWLDGKHTAFGKVIKGFEVVEGIGKVEVNKEKKPVKDVKILSVRLVKN